MARYLIKFLFRLSGGRWFFKTYHMYIEMYREKNMSKSQGKNWINDVYSQSYKRKKTKANFIEVAFWIAIAAVVFVYLNCQP